MKKLSFLLLTLIVSSLTLLSCGGSKAQPNASAPASSEPVAERLTPANVSASMPLDGADLVAAMRYWIGKEVTFTAYPNTFFSEEALKSGFTVRALATDDRKDKTKQLASVELIAADETLYKSDTPVLIQGTVKGTFDTQIEIVKAKIIPAQTAVGTTTSLDDLYTDIFGWKGKSVKVTGSYWGVTKSTTSYGDSWRIDILDKSGNKTVALSYTADPGEPVKKENLIITGTINGFIFDSVELIDAKIE